MTAKHQDDVDVPAVVLLAYDHWADRFEHFPCKGNIIGDPVSNRQSGTPACCLLSCHLRKPEDREWDRKAGQKAPAGHRWSDSAHRNRRPSASCQPYIGWHQRHRRVKRLPQPRQSVRQWELAEPRRRSLPGSRRRPPSQLSGYGVEACGAKNGTPAQFSSLMPGRAAFLSAATNIEESSRLSSSDAAGMLSE